MIAALAGGQMVAPAAAAECSEQAWLDFERELALAQAAFQQSDPEPLKSLWSQAEDVALLGAYGGNEIGWALVSARLDWVSAGSGTSAHDDDQVLVKVVGAKMALVVQLEHIPTYGSDGAVASMQHLRVTHVARCEGANWRLIHRHADPLVETRRPGK
jgi:ketosteroid isomerase-like protein